VIGFRTVSLTPQGPLYAAAQNRLDAGALSDYTCSVANIQEGSIRLKEMEVDAGVPVNDACSLST
jgi:hypothetical protein